MTTQELNIIRADFPLLAEKVYNKPLIYLDNAATTQKPLPVLERINYGYRHLNANIHRGVHYLSQQATEAHETARRFIAEYIGAASSAEIIFTRGTTEAINLVAFALGEYNCQPGDEIVVSAMEHHSNIVPWQMLCQRKGLKLRVAPLRPNGELNTEALEQLLGPKTKLVAVAHVSNVLGTINPVKTIVTAAHRQHIPVLIDGAQAMPHLEIDVQALDADFYVFSGHKVYAPTGIGVLYGKAAWLHKLPPYQGGGEMIQSVTFQGTTYNEPPFKFEAGTPDYIGSTALAEALQYIRHIGINRIAAHEKQLTDHATHRLSEIDGIRLIGIAPHKSAVVSFLIDGIHPYDIGMLLDKLGIAVRTGHHCAQPLMDLLGIPGTVRASFALYNTHEEVDNFIDALKRVTKMLR